MKILGIGVPELLIIIVIVIIIVVVVKNVVRPSQTAAPTAPKKPPTITAEEFEQSVKLYESGALNQEEFDAIRKRYLGL